MSKDTALSVIAAQSLGFLFPELDNLISYNDLLARSGIISAGPVRINSSDPHQILSPNFVKWSANRYQHLYDKQVMICDIWPISDATEGEFDFGIKVTHKLDLIDESADDSADDIELDLKISGALTSRFAEQNITAASVLDVTFNRVAASLYEEVGYNLDELPSSDLVTCAFLLNGLCASVSKTSLRTQAEKIQRIKDTLLPEAFDRLRKSRDPNIELYEKVSIDEQKYQVLTHQKANFLHTVASPLEQLL